MVPASCARPLPGPGDAARPGTGPVPRPVLQAAAGPRDARLRRSGQLRLGSRAGVLARSCHPGRQSGGGGRDRWRGGRTGLSRRAAAAAGAAPHRDRLLGHAARAGRRPGSSRRARRAAGHGRRTGQLPACGIRLVPAARRHLPLRAGHPDPGWPTGRGSRQAGARDRRGGRQLRPLRIRAGRRGHRPDGRAVQCRGAEHAAAHGRGGAAAHLVPRAARRAVRGLPGRRRCRPASACPA